MSPDARPLPVVSQCTSPQISTARLDFAPAPSDPHVELVPSALLHASWCIGQEVEEGRLDRRIKPTDPPTGQAGPRHTWLQLQPMVHRPSPLEATLSASTEE